jgi:hypothetical protein
MTEFQLYEDADISATELDNARRLLRNGEITNETFGWLVGLIDLEDEIPFHLMTAKQRRRYFAKQKAEKLGGMDLFGKPKGVVRRRKSKTKVLIRVAK